MNKINKFINKNTGIILIIFVLLQPVIDVLTSICINFDLIISIGVIVRVMFILFTMIVVQKRKLVK